MSERSTKEEEFTVRIFEPEDGEGTLVFAFAPKGLQQRNGNGGIPVRVPQYVVVAPQESSGPTFDWSRTPDDPGAAREEFQAEVHVRMQGRAAWIARVESLVDQTERWAREMGWSTRRVEKKLEDDWIGSHRVHALLMQEDTCRILLEPVGRSALGVEGVVDLYLMPAYDDIARLVYYDDRWILHYEFSGAKPGSIGQDAETAPLSKETFARVLVELRQNAV